MSGTVPLRGKDGGVRATERGAWLHATPVQLLAAAAGARRIDGFGTADGGARSRLCPCAGSNHAWGALLRQAWRGWVGEEGEVKIMLSAASLQVLPGLFSALDGLSSANWAWMVKADGEWMMIRGGVFTQETTSFRVLTEFCTLTV